MPPTPTSTKTSTLDVHRRYLRGWKRNQMRLQRLHGPGAALRPLSILAVDPGSRRIGYAVFEGTELVFGRVKDFGYQRHMNTVVRGTRKLIEDQIRYFRPQIVVLERTFAGYRNKDISKLVAVSEEIRTVARERALPTVEYAPRTARLIVLGNGNATKNQVAEALCLRYPELRIHLQQTHLWKETYWSNCYDAICVGLAYLIERRFASPIRVPTPPGALRPRARARGDRPEAARLMTTNTPARIFLCRGVSNGRGQLDERCCATSPGTLLRS